MKTRKERDSFGEIEIPEAALWGPSTQRSLLNFQIGREKMPPEIIEAIVLIKKASAIVNVELEVLDEGVGRAIAASCEKVLSGGYEDQFPLSLWQTGSGTQTNMNVNEVLSRLASRDFGLEVHPNDHVNKSQSTNDVFPTALHLSCLLLTEKGLLPAMDKMAMVLREKKEKYSSLVKIGRTHLQDAVPLTLGQEIGAWLRMIERCQSMIMTSMEYLKDLAIGGTAVGTGLNAPRAFGDKVAIQLGDMTGLDLRSAPDKFHSLSSKDEITAFHGTLKALASDLMKMANDVRWLSSGPRCGIGEIRIPENEAGSSMMPGKVNPTQAEALDMICLQVMANDGALGFAAGSGNFQLNVFMPIIAHEAIQSLVLLKDGIESFTERCLEGLTADEDRIASNLKMSLMVVTALVPSIGYDKAASIGRTAHLEGITLKEAALKSGYVTEKEFDSLTDPSKMV